MKKRTYIGIYFLWCLLYMYINESVFKSTLIHLEYVGIVFGVLDLLAIAFNYKPKLVCKLNIVIWIILFTSFLFLPQYTYKDAVKIISNLEIENSEIIDYTSKDYRYKIGTPQIYMKERTSFLLAGEYLVYLLDKNTDTIIWYKVNPLDGTYSVFSEIPN